MGVFKKIFNKNTKSQTAVNAEAMVTENTVCEETKAIETTNIASDFVMSSSCDYNAYSSYRNVNVIPEYEFKQLVGDTFQTLTETLRRTYGPYGSQIMISESSNRTSTKDGYNVFRSMHFTNNYKTEVYSNIARICERVNYQVGDGTTSCILLAEKMFKIIDSVIQTPNDKRNAKKILDKIEKILQRIAPIKKDTEDGIIKPLTTETMRNMLSMADNYDEDLADILYNAFDPVINEDNTISHISTIIPKEIHDMDSRTDVDFKINELPGKYRIRVHNALDHIVTEAHTFWTNAKIAIYDHTFNLTDWNELIYPNGRDKDKDNRVLDNTPLLIIATGLAAEVKQHEFAQYITKRNLAGDKTCPISFYIIRYGNISEEIADLAAVFNVDPYRLIETRKFSYDDLPEARFKVNIEDCMCFDNVTAPEGYIENLRQQMSLIEEDKYARRKDMMHRIEALSMKKTDDKNLILKGTNPLELRLISDKVDDCTNIIESAINYGTVPNMLKYGYYRLNNIDIDTEIDIDHDVSVKIIDSMKHAIKGLFIDIWRSKYGATKDTEGLEVCDKFYDENGMVSYDIIDEEIVDFVKFPTSAQYDLEVIVASLSIVKFLLTSNAFVFDAKLLNRQIPMEYQQMM